MRKSVITAALASAGALSFATMTPAERRAGRFMRGPDHPPEPNGPDGQKADAIIAKIKEDLGKAADKAKEIAETALGKAESGEAMGKAAKEAVDEILIKHNALAESLAALEQKLAADPGDATGEVKSLGTQFLESDGFKSVQELEGNGMRGKGAMEVKAVLTSLTTDAAGSVGNGIRPTRLPEILGLAQQQLTMRDLITPGQMDTSTLEYVQQHGFTNAAAMVAEGAAKPQSDIKLKLVSTTARVIAHHMKASRQVLEDLAQLRSLIDFNLIYGLKLKEDRQILSGDGTGQNLKGLIPSATAFALPGGIVAADVTSIIDVLRVAMLQTVLAEYPATGHVLNPIDWAKIEMLKNDNDEYVIGQPSGVAPPRLWGLPVVATQAMPVGDFLTGAFRLGAQLFDRWQARVQIATENEDDFVKNMLTILAEERLALAIYRPEAFITGDLVVPV